MQRLVDQFPVLAIGAFLVVLVLALRLNRRIDPGPTSAGPVETARVTPPGQEPTPWELRAIDDQLKRLSGSGPGVRRSDLTATVNRLITAAGLPASEQLPPAATLSELAVAVSVIEDRLGLPPLTPQHQDR